MVWESSKPVDGRMAPNLSTDNVNELGIRAPEVAAFVHQASVILSRTSFRGAPSLPSQGTCDHLIAARVVI
jgi:hypothetical protein